MLLFGGPFSWFSYFKFWWVQHINLFVHVEQSVSHNTQLRALQLALSIRNLTFDSTGELCTFISFFVFWIDLGIDKF